MQHFTLNPCLCESFKQQMLTKHWQISHQDAGQTHLVGWGYEITWQKAAYLVTLRYSDKQGIATALLEISDGALPDMTQLIDTLNE